MRLIVIGGGSGSGKTTLAHYLSETLRAERAPVLCVDRYYRSLAHLPPIQRESVNFDHPDAFDWEYFSEHLSTLFTGESVLVPEYDYATHSRVEAHPLKIGDFLILEGIMALFPEFVRKRAELTVFVDAPERVRFERRLARDVSERGRTPESVKSWWRERVEPMFAEHCAPLAHHADLIVSGEDEISKCAAPILERILRNAL